MDYSNLIISICSGIGVIFSLYTLLSKKFDQIDERFVKMDEKFSERTNSLDVKFSARMDILDVKFTGKLEKLQEDVSDVKERLSFLEASSIYTMPSEPPKPTTRSEIAKAMWRKRRSKQIEKK